MVPLEASGPNAEQIRYWNETAGPKWIGFQQVLDEQLGALGRRAMDRAGVARRERVIDVGCGCGDTTIELGRRVGPQGTVVGVDVSTPMLERAATQARAAQLANVRLENADAQTHRFPPGQCDLVFSRFGVMFFADPVTAFMNFADPERVRTILVRGGFVEIAFEERREMLTVGGGASLDQTVQFLLQGVGPTSAALREADPAVRPRVAAAVRDALAPFHTAAGVRLGSAAWIVTARR